MPRRELFAGTLRLWRVAAVWWPLGWGLYVLLVGWLVAGFGPLTELQARQLESLPQELGMAFGIDRPPPLAGGRRDLVTFMFAGQIYGSALIIAAIFAMFMAPGLVAREADRGTLDTLLARPLTRRAYVWTRFAFYALVAVAFAAASLLATALSYGAIAGLEVPWLGFLLVSGELALAAIAFGAIGFAAAAWRLSTGAGTALVAVALAAMFALNIGRLTTDWLDAPSHLSFFRFWHPVAIVLEERIEPSDLLVYAGVAAAFAVLAAEIFHRRDIA